MKFKENYLYRVWDDDIEEFVLCSETSDHLYGDIVYSTEFAINKWEGINSNCMVNSDNPHKEYDDCIDYWYTCIGTKNDHPEYFL